MITDKTVIDAINVILKENYRNLDGRPIYRIVWSEDEIEVRKGKFSDFYGHIFIREYTAVKPIKKYWYFNRPCWVLEKLCFIAGNQALKEIEEELVECRNGTYETIFPFRDDKENPLPVNFEIVDWVVWKLHNPGKEDLKKLEMAEEKEEMHDLIEDISEGERSPLFVWENSAFVSTNQSKFKKEYTEKSNLIEIAGA